MNFRMAEIRIETVQVVGRYRKDLGDVDTLAKSIASIGLINPITITPDGQLIAGQRRLEACRRLGWDTIQARVAEDLAEAVERLTAERDENEERKEMLPSERVALARALEEFERPRAEQRYREGVSRGGKILQGTYEDPAPCSPDQGAESVNTRDVVAKAVGMSGATYQRARAVVDAAETAPDPEVRKAAQEALAEMDATGKVMGPYDKVRAAKTATSGTPQRPTIDKAAQQRKAFTGAINTLAGITHGLSQIGELHPDITSDEAAQWVSGLADARRVIESVIKRCRERSNAHA